jgi:alpha-beta hydrolase superfamily lysophospholipase
MAVWKRWVAGAAVLSATLAPAIRAAAAPPDLVLKTRTFLPGKDVVAPSGENFIYTPTAPQNGRLVILLPGSSMDRYEDFMTAAAAHGYHVLALDSPLTAKGKGDACPPQADCYGHLLRQAVDGDMTEAPPFWSRDYPQARYPQAKNSVLHRLVALLEYLKAEHQGSGQFLLCRDAEACEPDWPKLVVAGHSNGAAVALWLLQRHHGTGMRALVSKVSGTPGLDPLDARWKNDVTVLESADCASLEDGDGERCAWDRLLTPY